MNLRMMLTTAIIATLTGSAMAQGNARQEDKNFMRNLGLGLGAAALSEARKGNTKNATVLGAAALYAGKKYEDQRRAQNWENDRYDRFDRYDRGDRGRWDRDDCRSDRSSRFDRRDRDDDCDRHDRGRRGRGRKNDCR